MMKFFQYLITAVSYILKPEKRKLIRSSYDLKNKIGLEIGGPSNFFDLKSYFPVYLFAKRIDGVNFSNETVWEGKINEGKNYIYAKKKIGFQYICEASDLQNITPNSYDFLLSCHSLEHIANPIKALKSWYNVLNEKGRIVLVLPDKDYTFDKNRPYTKFEHLLDDFKNNTSEKDSTHFEEVIKLHFVEKDQNIHSTEELRNRVGDNYINRCVHHHVFNLDLLEHLLTYCNFKIVHKQKVSPFHLVIIGEKNIA